MRERGVVSVIRTHGAGFHRHNVSSLIPSTRQAWAVLMPSPRSASAFSSFTTICSGVCFEIFLMVIHSARPHTARTTQNNPLTTNGPKNPDPSRCNIHLSGVTPLSDKPNHGQGLNHTRGHYTRYVALHPLRGAAPEQKGCNAYGSGVAPTPTSPTADTHTSAMGRHCTTERVRTLLRVCLCGCGPGRSLLLGLA